jgi:DNA-directed RNA polymerase alpha subunit
MAVLVFSLPILVWSLSERAYRAIYHRIHPSVDDLDISQRLVHILHRHGVHTIRDVSRRDDPELLLMANMEPRDVDVLRRAVNLWRYRRWQEAGFPASGAD